MTFTIPNADAVSFPAQAEIMQADIDIMTAGQGGIGVKSGFAVTGSGAADNKVNVALGVLFIDPNELNVAAGSVTLTAPDATNPRIDLVWVDSTGTLGKTDGTAAANPVAPGLPANTVALAMVYSPAAGGNTVASSWIIDKRVMIRPGWSTVYLASDLLINSGAANTLTDITGISFTVKNGGVYHFHFFGSYTVGATTTGSRWSVNGPTMNFLWYHSTYGLTATTVTDNPMLTAVQLPASANATSNISNGGGNIAEIYGQFSPSADGTFQIQGAREVSTDTVTLKAGAMMQFKRAA